MKKLPLYIKIIMGMIVGIILGFIANAAGFGQFITNWVSPWGVIFIRLLKLVAIPLVFFSLVQGIGTLQDIKQLSRIGIKTIFLFVATTLVSICIGLGVVYSIKPGNVFPEENADEYRQAYGAVVQQTGESAEVVSSAGPLDIVVNMIPENMISAAANNSNILQVIIIAILIGIAMVSLDRKKTASLSAVFESLNDIILKIIHYIMLFAPYGVLALMADLVISFSGDGKIFAALGMYVICVALGLLIIGYLFYPLLIKFFTRIKPLDYLKAMGPVQLVAFSTSSSAATLPVTMESAENNLKISNQTASFVLPVGVTINMGGTSCYQTVAVVFIAQVLGLDLTFTQLLTVIMLTVISSIGTPGIPGGSIVMIMIVLESIGIPAEWLALILGVDRPLDMMRTVINVTGDTTVAAMVDEGENKRNAKTAVS